MPPQNVKPQGECANFTMLYLDLDDTLIPTTLRNSICDRYGFAEWKIVDTISLQNTIIQSIENIKKTLIKYNPDDHIQFCVVSMASQKWIDTMLFPENSMEFSTLGAYFKNNKISTISAQEHTYEYLYDTFGEIKADKLVNNFEQKREMYKYTIFEQWIKKYENKLNMKCNQIISIGDGKCEQKAIKMFAENNNDIMLMNICFHSSPTMPQLYSQWTYITKYFDKIIRENMTNIGKYFEINVHKMLKQSSHHNNGSDIVGVISTLYSGFAFIAKFL